MAGKVFIPENSGSAAYSVSVLALMHRTFVKRHISVRMDGSIRTYMDEQMIDLYLLSAHLWSIVSPFDWFLIRELLHQVLASGTFCLTFE